MLLSLLLCQRRVKLSRFQILDLLAWLQVSLYNIIAKVLAKRLRKVIHETISSSQGAIVQGRQILNTILIANEMVDEKRKSGEEGIVFKIDFEKA